MPGTDLISRESQQCETFFERLRMFSTPLAIKLYRIRLNEAPTVPVLPCLDHEAMLHEGIAAHAAAYIQDVSGNLHEVVYIPEARRIDVDVVSTMGECTTRSHDQLVATLKTTFPHLTIRVVGPSWLRGDRRVAKACRAQVALRDVLTGTDLDETKRAVDRLQMISSLMEKESRVASWGARTVMTPILAVAGFLTYQLLGRLGGHIDSNTVELLRYAIIGILGGSF